MRLALHFQIKTHVPVEIIQNWTELTGPLTNVALFCISWIGMLWLFVGMEPIIPFIRSNAKSQKEYTDPWSLMH